MATSKLEVIKAPIISLVENPANQRMFFVTKEKTMNIFDYFPEPDGEVDEENVEDALETTEKWAEDLPDEMKSALGVLFKAGYSEEEEEDVVKAEDILQPMMDRLDGISDKLEEYQKENDEVDVDYAISLLVEAMKNTNDASYVWDLLDEKLGKPEDIEKGEEEEEDEEPEEEEEDETEEEENEPEEDDETEEDDEKEEEDREIPEELAEQLSEAVIESVSNVITGG